MNFRICNALSLDKINKTQNEKWNETESQHNKKLQNKAQNEKKIEMKKPAQQKM